VLSSDSDDSFKKICLKASSILFAARLRIVFMLAFISWNENNNGFDLVGCILYLLFGCLFSEMMKYLHIARHLAAKFGTFSAFLI